MSNENNYEQEEINTSADTGCADEGIVDAPAEKAVPSIFDAPEKSYKKVRKKAPKWLVAALSVVLCAALVVGAVYIPKFIKEDPASSSSTPSQAEVTITLCDYKEYNDTLEEVAAYGRGGIKNIVYTVGGFDFELTQGEYEETTTDSEGNEKTAKKVGWTISNYEGIRWSDSNISGLVQNALTVTAITKLAENVTDLALYGLDDEGLYSSLSVNFKNGTGYKVRVGNYSGDKSGRYICFEGESTVYLSSYSFATYTSLAPTELPGLYSLGLYESNGKDADYYNDGTLMYFDGIFMFGRKQPESIVFAPTDNQNTYTYYKMMQPVEMATNDTAVQEVFSLVSAGITATEVLEFMPSDETVASYGLAPKLDNNYLKVMFIIAGVTHQFAIGDPLEDGSYPVMVNSANVIYKVSKDVFTFIDYDYTDYMRETLFLAGIVDMKSFSVKGEGMDQTFHITNIAEDAENNVYKQTVKIKNGKSVDDAKFKTALAAFQRLQATEFDSENYGKTDKSPVFTVTVKYLDEKRPDSVITFYEYSARRYLYKIDGEGNALVNIADYEGVIEKLKTAQSALI